VGTTKISYQKENSGQMQVGSLMWKMHRNLSLALIKILKTVFFRQNNLQ